MPEYVDRVYVVDDASIDKTTEITQAIASQNGKVKLLGHQQNGGVGKAITTGYNQALAEGIDITAVMAGDNQMAPVHLPMLLDPLVEGVADYAKGDRLSQPGYKKGMTPMAAPRQLPDLPGYQNRCRQLQAKRPAKRLHCHKPPGVGTFTKGDLLFLVRVLQ
jgi:glycosyltransferase involved in cell wall biosynthesis